MQDYDPNEATFLPLGPTHAVSKVLAALADSADAGLGPHVRAKLINAASASRHDLPGRTIPSDDQGLADWLRELRAVFYEGRPASSIEDG